MSRILLAWELGAGFGHLGPFLMIANRLLERGHELLRAFGQFRRGQTAQRAAVEAVIEVAAVPTLAGFKRNLARRCVTHHGSKG